MLRGLRLRLTILYMLVALGLIALVGGGAYRVLASYFESTTDLALQRKLAAELLVLGAPVPRDLAAAEAAWQTRQDTSLPGVARAAVRELEHEGPDQGTRDSHDLQRAPTDAYDAELAAVFVLPLRADGSVAFDPNPAVAPLPPDHAALDAALARGTDWRTVVLADGTRARLFTYRLGGSGTPAALQVGRTLADQDRVLGQLTAGLLGLGGVATLLMGVGSWWLAGRSLAPMERAWEQQRGFVASASHELRTPLTLIRASAEVARRGLAADDDRRALLDDVLGECDHVGKLVEDLLLLSRLDAGRLPLVHEPVPLAGLLADLQRQVGRLAEEQGVALAASGDGLARADPTRLRQVLLILLDNALRYTPAGGSVEARAWTTGRQAHVTVSDSGPGIAPEHLSRVFERFYRADAARGSEGGSGLGLAIAKALVEAMDGRIALESAPGKGTRATVMLPGEQPGRQPRLA
jgi:signal transduction histidine kinase